MEIDVRRQLDAVGRVVSAGERDGEPVHTVALSRSYDTTLDDLWDAVTRSGRIERWFLPVDGELTAGGRYRIEGNASGTITECEPGSRFALTWEFGESVSWVGVRLSAEGDGRTRLALEHTEPLSEHWAEYGPGAVGVGWELALLGLALHLEQPAGPRLDEAAFGISPKGTALIAGSSGAWAQAAIAAGTEPEQARAAAARTTAFYTGDAAAG
ncbi:MAG: SRPBCC domain-containing protein [Chloroflexi bacterium]|nr:SRPBCC domain-containing protein [Chloroflexota bacterium]